MKTAAVTGATGFIGKNMVEELVKHGIEVQAIVRKIPENKISSPLVQYIQCNLNDYDKLHCLVKKVDVLYHFAWSGVSGELNSSYQVQLQNIEATLKLFDKQENIFFKRFIGAGSLHEIECYNEMNMNQRITNWGNMYKAAKLAAHYMTRTIANKSGVDFLWPIITNTYGEGEKSARLINSVIRQLLRGDIPELTLGDQLYDFIYIKDVVNAFYLLGISGISNENYTIGSGNPKPLFVYLDSLRDIVDPNMKLGYGMKQYKGIYLQESDFSIATLIRDTKFKPKVSFREGIEKTCERIKKEELNLM